MEDLKGAVARYKELVAEELEREVITKQAWRVQEDRIDFYRFALFWVHPGLDGDDPECPQPLASLSDIDAWEVCVTVADT